MLFMDILNTCIIIYNDNPEHRLYQYKKNYDIQLTMPNNDEIEEKLNVIVVHFNPMKFKRIKN